ncbi:MAG: DUF4159 domain-containing protein [Sedimentisphaerales bacterium]|nr:DUF4159 domain-containing protein [Sedimentisphaerales bacterium]
MIKRRVFFLIILLCLASSGVLAQIYYSRDISSGRTRGGRGAQSYPDQRSMGRGRGGLTNQQFLDPRARENLFQWDVDPEFKQDVFTFVRIAYNSGYGGMRSGRSRSYRTPYGGVSFGGTSFGGPSATDWPDSDNNFSYRLHQVTSIEVNPEPVILELTDPELFNYPFIYIVEPGSLSLSADEVNNLRKYLLNGGFLMLDDFWGNSEWINVYTQMKRVFPEREPVELTLEHPLFHCVFNLKEMPQIPAYTFALRDRETLSGITTERSDAPRAIFYGIYDDKGRMMAVICRDTDLGDGWEREGESHAYFSEFSEKKAYPLGINIVFYAMTH